jgi:hypothetical protein
MRGLFNLLCFVAIIACAVFWPAGLLALICLCLGTIYNELTLLRKPVNELAKLFCTPLDELPMVPLSTKSDQDMVDGIIQRIEQSTANLRKFTKH